MAIQDRSYTSEETSRITSPPLPPSPPSGPPRGTWASRRNDAAPSPPRPPRTSITASSTKVAISASIGFGMGPEPRVVWLIRPGSPEAARGRLSVERHALTFTGDGEEEPLPIPLNRVRRVRRRRGAPILEVEYTDARAELSRVFLFFVEPPPLPRTGGRSWILPTRGMQRAASAGGPRTPAPAPRAEIDEWGVTIQGRSMSARAGEPGWVTASRSGLVDRDQTPAPGGVEPDHAGHHGEQGVVAAPGHPGPGMDAGAPLAHDDRAGLDGRAGEGLHAEPLGLAVPAVPGRRRSLLVRHEGPRIPASGRLLAAGGLRRGGLLRRGRLGLLLGGRCLDLWTQPDLVDFEQRHQLAVPLGPSVPALRPVLEDPDLVAPLVAEELRRDSGLRQALSVVGLAVVVDDQDRIELDRGSRVDLHELDLDHVARGDPLLFPSDLDHGVHPALLVRSRRG